MSIVDLINCVYIEFLILFSDFRAFYIDKKLSRVPNKKLRYVSMDILCSQSSDIC